MKISASIFFFGLFETNTTNGYCIVDRVILARNKHMQLMLVNVRQIGKNKSVFHSGNTGVSAEGEMIGSKCVVVSLHTNSSGAVCRHEVPSSTGKS